MIPRQVRGALLALAALIGPRSADAQQVALRHYTVDDGLANDTVGSAFQDSRGFLWFATAEGLSRYDGYRFVTYTKRDGLGADVVHRVDESPDGTLWVATAAGLARLLDAPGRGTFVAAPVGPHRGVSTFAVAADGGVWCLQEDGAYRGLPAGQGVTFTRVAAQPPLESRPRTFSDRSGRLWISRNATLFHVDGASLVPHPHGPSGDPIRGIAERADGSLLVATTRQLWSITQGTAGTGDRWQPAVRELDGLHIQALTVDSRDRVWIGTAAGLLAADVKRGDATPVRGLTDDVRGILEDGDGNLWITTANNGVFKMAPEPIVSYTKADGLMDTSIAAIVEGDGGRIYAVTHRGGTFEIREGGAALLSGSTASPFTSVRRSIVHDGQSWWMWTTAGLYRVDGALDFRRAMRVNSAWPPPSPEADGPALATDGPGVVWIGTRGGEIVRAARDATIGAWPATRLDRGVPPPGPLARTRGGALWVGTRSQLVRLTGDRTETFGVPDPYILSLFVDSRGWLWAGSFNGGVSVTRDPDAPKPVFRNYSDADGLASAFVSSIAEDRHGRIYLVTGRGLDRLDPQSGRIRHITTADGLVSAKVTYCMRDGRGHMWIGTTAGVSRLVPSRDHEEHSPPPVLITAVRAAEEEMPVAPRGTRGPLSLRLAPHANVHVEYVALDFTGENTLRYQFRLGGADRPWSAPTDSRTVIYGNLAAGTYAFAVRAVNADGRIGPETAALTFTVLPPIWQRWWFILLAVAATAAVGVGLYRQRMNHLLAVERVRRQVALDLHDDVGAGLVQIAAMGELAAEDARAGDRMWPDIAAIARELRDSMSDIVWAVDPNKDHLGDLVQRLKDVAYASLEANGIAVEFNAPARAEMSRIQMPTDRRRHVLLVLKEAVTNIVRHAGATAVRIDLALRGRELHLVICDDGVGFKASEGPRGNGLGSMRRRAADVGGRLEIVSTPGQGTTVSLVVPA